MGKNLKVGANVYTIYGNAGVIVAMNGDKVTIKCNLFKSEYEIDAADVSRSKNVAWGSRRSI